MNIQLVRKAIFLVAISLIAGGLLASCGKDNKIVIGSKNFTENIILGEIMAQMIEAHTDLEVDRKHNMGPTFILFSALKSHEIDMYPDYTGTLYQANLKQTKILPAEETYEYVRTEMDKLGYKVFNSFGFNNTYAIGVLSETAEKYGLKKISDLKNAPDLLPGFDSEFVERKDGGKELFKAYGLQFNNDIVSMEIGLKLNALVNKEIDFTDAFSTDSKLLRYHVVILEDDKKFFPPYYAVPLVHKDTLKKHPELNGVLDKLKSTITEDEMMQLNYTVEEDKVKVGKAVADWLQTKGLN